MRVLNIFRMKNGVIFLLFITQVSGVPTLTVNNYDSSDAVRTSASTQGLVNGKDYYVIKASAERPNADVTEFLNNAIFVDTSADQIIWKGLPGCLFDITSCSQAASGADCYCESEVSSSAATTYNLVINSTADINDSGKYIRVRWQDRHLPGTTEFSNQNVTLPYISEQAVLTAEHGSDSTTLINSGTTISTNVDKLRFCITNLDTPYTLTVSVTGGQTVTQTSQLCVQTRIATGNEVTFSYDETTGAARKASFVVTIAADTTTQPPTQPTTTSGPADDGPSDVLVIVVSIMAVLIVLLVIALTVYCYRWCHCPGLEIEHGNGTIGATWSPFYLLCCCQSDVLVLEDKSGEQHRFKTTKTEMAVLGLPSGDYTAYVQVGDCCACIKSKEVKLNVKDKVPEQWPRGGEIEELALSAKFNGNLVTLSWNRTQGATRYQVWLQKVESSDIHSICQRDCEMTAAVLSGKGSYKFVVGAYGRSESGTEECLLGVSRQIKFKIDDVAMASADNTSVSATGPDGGDGGGSGSPSAMRLLKQTTVTVKNDATNTQLKTGALTKL